MSASNSPNATPSSSSEALTPGRKVQALLDGLSDSDSGKSEIGTSVNHAHGLALETEDASSEDDVLPRSRIASRFARETNTATQVRSSTQEELNETESAGIETEQSQDIGDTIPFAPKRRLLNKRKSSPIHISRDGSPRPRSASPMFFSSPPANRMTNNLSPRQATENSNDTQTASTDGKAKFLALVEKHRKERLAKEAEEIMKRVAGSDQDESDAGSPRPKKQRGSSPADDSAEDSDASVAGAAKKLSRESRPTRKASKKALEEMNRETQRISRNMQLAHQARTKKKITKESLLARFNFVSSDNENEARNTSTSTTTTSSVPGSDNEFDQSRDTPPTSPLQDPQDKQVPAADAVDEQFMAPSPVSENRNDLVSKTAIKDQAPIIANNSEERQQIEQQQSVALLDSSKMEPSRTTSLSTRAFLCSTQGDSDSDLEVITEKGSKRKFVAFETLPKRKAKEIPSHLALRSLANLMGDHKKRATGTAEMEAKLRRAARQQAKEERQAKIELLKAKGVFIQTAEEREREQQVVEDLVERARQEAVEIQKRERALAKKDGTFVKDALDDEDSDDDEDDGDFADDDNDEHESGSEDDEVDEADEEGSVEGELFDEAAQEGTSDDELALEEDAENEEEKHQENQDSSGKSHMIPHLKTPAVKRNIRNTRVISDDEDEMTPSKYQSPALPSAHKTPQSIVQSARKMIPGLQMSDDLPLGLTQAFAATMADSQTQDDEAVTEEQDSLDILRGLPSPYIASQPAGLRRLSSAEVISDSVPASQTQPLDVNLSIVQSERVPESPAGFTQVAASQAPFELTQDAGYSFSPFTGNRFAETPSRTRLHSATETITASVGDESPILQRKGRLVRGRLDQAAEAGEDSTTATESAFNVMRKAAKKKALQAEFNRKRSEARGAVDEAAEESDDEYAGLGGASDEDSDEEANEDDRKMIDEDTQIGKGDEARLAQLHADRERQSDEAAVSKLLKDITTGALRRKRGVGDDLDLSDEEDVAARRREAKRREFAKMRRELLKDEAVNKIAEDKRKEAFLRSIEDREDADDADDDFEASEAVPDDDSQNQSQQPSEESSETIAIQNQKQPLRTTSDSQLNRNTATRHHSGHVHRKPATLAEIRESVSFLIEESDSQAATIDLGLSDSEEEPEAYVNLDRHFKEAEAYENTLDDDDTEDLGDFVVDDNDDENTRDSQNEVFKKPNLPLVRSQDQIRAPFNERRTKNATVIDRLSLIRQASSSSSSSSSSSKMAFFTSTSANLPSHRVPNLLRRATTNSSLGSMSGRDVSATGVVTNKTERGSVSEEKEFVRKGSNTNRNAVNYQGRANVSLREEKMSARAGVHKLKAKAKKTGGGFLGGLFRGDSWG